VPAEDRADPRWVLAVAAAAALEGGRGAVLVPERRRRLMRLSASLGVRAFDASLVLAIVQDAARRGEPLGGAAESLRMVGWPGRPGRGMGQRPGVLLALSGLLGAAWAAVLIGMV
jgi:hypothetical protein